MAMAIVLGADIIHLIDAATLGAPIDRALAGHLEEGGQL